MHNTGNPLGSKDILDLYDNSEVVDNFVNSQQDEIPDRFGSKRLTLAGLIKRSMALRNEINDFSGALTFIPEWSVVPMNVSEGVGGEGGALNLQAEALGNRSELLKSKIDTVSKSFVFLDDYEYLVNDNDWSVALQSALDTGSTVIPNPNFTYQIGGIIQSKGNKILGPFNIKPTRDGIKHLGEFTFINDNNSFVNNNLKLIYCFKVYDLIELMFLRSLGFNTILHAGSLYVDRPELTNETLKDAIKLALDNALTANLRVNMTTGWVIDQDYMAIDYVETFCNHSAVWGFSVFDEPSFHNITVERQRERLNALRAITNKNLNCVDVIQNYSDYRDRYNPWANSYDVMFVDAYSHTVPGLNTQELIAKDLSDMRLSVGVAAAFCSGSKIIPVCGLFKSPSFSNIFEQIKNTSSKLVATAGGDFGVWAWDPLDPGVTSGVKTDMDFIKLSKYFCEMEMSGSKIPKAYRVGGTSFNPGVIPPVAAKDNVRILQKQAGVNTFVQGGTSALGVLRNGPDAEFTFPSVTGEIAGILFKGTFPVAITNIQMQSHMTIDFELADVTGAQAGSMSFRYTHDEGATLSPPAASFDFIFTNEKPAISKTIYFNTGDYWRDTKLAFDLAINEPAAANFRLCFLGFVVTSDW